MATAVTGAVFSHFFFFRNRFLGKTGKGIEFTKDANNWFALSELSNKGGIDAVYMLPDSKTCLFQCCQLQSACIFFLISDLRIVPNLLCHRSIRMFIFLQPVDDCFFTHLLSLLDLYFYCSIKLFQLYTSVNKL